MEQNYGRPERISCKMLEVGLHKLLFLLGGLQNDLDVMND
jgi:hypothetical protein